MNSLRKEFQKPIVQYGLIAIAFIVAMRLLFLPWLDWRSDKVGELRQAKSLLITEEAVGAAMLRLQDATIYLDATLDQIRPQFEDPSSNPAVDFPASARDVFEAAGLVVNSVAAEEVASIYPGLRAFVINLDLEGSISSLLEAVELLQQGERHASFDRVSVYNTAPDSAKIRVEIRRYVL